MVTYVVRIWGGATYTVAAATGSEAKRTVCKMLGRSASVPLIGAKGMTAKRV